MDVRGGVSNPRLYNYTAFFASGQRLPSHLTQVGGLKYYPITGYDAWIFRTSQNEFLPSAHYSHLLPRCFSAYKRSQKEVCIFMKDYIKELLPMLPVGCALAGAYSHIISGNYFKDFGSACAFWVIEAVLISSSCILWTITSKKKRK